ncbi:transcription-repair coupling factor [Dethiosulfovibrio peptidovorans DSM 11002]|uniref:Transcription-repair-coupling factor n=1 Tax=Dethiosulfovibrio peptidovorans DSM 11002 TaxID=469381 RepID=D2Z2T5_9BACT|nr:DEAD/DEAH box helicase [Dethiosulfovibrio peptidovorans]EFC92098.1 transcription-repair coupling factor [Dethiosulfovibrio peptidovorans DSM 11002]
MLDLFDGSRAFFFPFKGAVRAWICRERSSRLTVLLPDENQAEDFYSDAKILLSHEKIFRLPDIPLEKGIVDDPASMVARGHVLRKWSEEGGILISTPGGMMSPFMNSEGLLSLRIGECAGRDRLISWLDSSGYSRSDLVWKPGEYAVRGGIVDLFDPSSRMPLRVVFFDDEIEEMRLFSPEDQTSKCKVEAFSVWELGDRVTPSAASTVSEKGEVFLFDPIRSQINADSFRSIWNDLSAKWNIPEERWDRFLIDTPLLYRFESGLGVRQRRLSLREVPRFRGRISEMAVQISRWREQGYYVAIRSSSPLPSDFEGMDWQPEPLSSGFIDDEEKMVFLSDVEMYGIRPDRRTERQGTPKDWSILFEARDWLVHEDHGLCRYGGLESVEGSWGRQEFLVLEFQDKKRLLLPTGQISRISPYKGSVDESTVPDRLGSSRWSTSLRKAERQIEEEAKELLELYAKRKIAKGHAFSPDGEAMEEFERSFPHEETIDQLKAISDVKKDMESPRPMDRLVVGDVGYGKTEVALRAVFKAAMDGFQVLVLVPTTVLAQQHYMTFRSRMGPFPLKVELLSRFVSQRRQNEILTGLADGSVDVVIGTHRLLQNDLKIRRLGLIIVDEEHRFGVAHKERFRKLRSGVDVLTLSATPIPRTFSMAMKGMRDVSIIETPPGNRPAIITVTGAWDDGLVRKALAREMARGGQVYMLHNRVGTIEERAGWVKSRFPDVRVAFAHGRMRENELEETMMAFYDGEIDILVCTTIVESGLDVGRANTLVVDDSRLLGLAQMHQLRGRVGRRDDTAYAFFLYPSDCVLPHSTAERLDAIGRLSFQGAGYELAKEDLHIRGGGDLLGMSQHGHRERVGLQLYYRKLRDEVDRLRGGTTGETEMEIRIPLSIPESYISVSALRLAIYRRIDEIEDLEGRENLRNELQDRFGPIPSEVDRLLDLALLRTICRKRGIIRCMLSEERCEITLGEKTDVRLSALWTEKKDEMVGPGGRSGIISLLDILTDRKSTEGVIS